MAEEKTKKKATVSPASSGTSLARRTEPLGLARGIDSIFDEFRRSFDDLMRPFWPWTTDIEQAMTLPTRYAPVDLVDNGDSYTVTAELPGFSKDQVDVQITKEGVSINAECKEEKEEKRKNYLHRERTYSSMRRYIAFPEEAAPDKAEGSMKDGVLELKVPKKEPKPEEKPRKVELK
ncbi:MAG: Hsp20/alpha crystallin family protein [Candidatus Bathyarchaeota archaeon]|nr:Hsp20/alpha crystallin family protein [Candidatus Bathyarchaeota archaeon]